MFIPHTFYCSDDMVKRNILFVFILIDSIGFMCCSVRQIKKDFSTPWCCDVENDMKPICYSDCTDCTTVGNKGKMNVHGTCPWCKCKTSGGATNWIKHVLQRCTRKSVLYTVEYITNIYKLRIQQFKQVDQNRTERKCIDLFYSELQKKWKYNFHQYRY